MFLKHKLSSTRTVKRDERACVSETQSLRPLRVRRLTLVEDVLRRALGLVESFDELVRAELPPDAELFDAHVHLGLDIDGMRGDLDELLRIQRAHGISRSFMFCLDEPDRHPGFRAPNDRTLAFADQSDGELIPFVRLDLTESPIEEAVRCLDRGAGGIKLHPRAQKFLLDDERLAPVFELAAERSVPILIHGGRGQGWLPWQGRGWFPAPCLSRHPRVR